MVTSIKHELLFITWELRPSLTAKKKVASRYVSFSDPSAAKAPAAKSSESPAENIAMLQLSCICEGWPTYAGRR